jgi:hypothetical protein
MEQSQGRCGIYLWIVLGITRVQRNGLQVKTAVQVDRSHDVPFQGEKKSQPMVSLGWGHKETQGFEKQTWVILTAKWAQCHWGCFGWQRQGSQPE